MSTASGEATGVLYRGGVSKPGVWGESPRQGLGRQPPAGCGAAAPQRKFRISLYFFVYFRIGFLGHLFVSSLTVLYAGTYCDYQMRTY